mmetsp:Transcript_35/g.122  ORF Transcript_35/g.122 Transcript_35/m.122 type:complete len:181 (+) Transcript_35:203-745(+)
MPLFGAAARSEPCAIVWRAASGELAVVEFDALGDAEDAWSRPGLLLRTCVLFIQQPTTGQWIPWRTYGWPSAVERLKLEFADPTVRRRLFAVVDGGEAAAGDVPVVADRDPRGAVAAGLARRQADVVPVAAVVVGGSSSDDQAAVVVPVAVAVSSSSSSSGPSLPPGRSSSSPSTAVVSS